MSCLVLLAVQGALLAVLIHGSHLGRLHKAPVTIVAPAVVAQSLAEDTNALAGRPFQTVATDDPAAALDDVRDGVVVAALTLDLSRTTDTLAVNDSQDPRLNRAVIGQVRTLERARQRTVVVRSVSRASAVPVEVVYRLALAASVIGFGMVVVLSLRRGPVARTVRMDGLRLVGLAVAGLLVGYVLATVGGFDGSRVAAVAGVVAACVLLAGALTLALEAVAGLSGVGLAVVLFVVMSTPLLLGTDPVLLPEPWRSLTAWVPTGASVEALYAVAVFDGIGLHRPALVLLGWFVLAVVALFVARRARPVDQFAFEGSDGTPDADTRHSGSRGRAPVGMWRVHVGLVVVPVAAALVAAVALVPHDDVAASAPVASRATQTRCVATGRVDSVSALNRIATRLRGGPAFQGADVGADVVLQDGRRLMVFGDTLRGEKFDGQRFVRNSMLVFGSNCLQAVLPADHGAIIPDRSEGNSLGGQIGYWPMSVGAAHRPGYDLAYIAAQRVRTTGEGVFGFENLGPAIAVYVVALGGVPQLVALRDIGPDSNDKSRPEWGAASTVDHGWLYLYGTANPGTPYVFGYSLRVARVRPVDILDESAWRYWNGHAWVPDADAAAELIGAAGGVSQTLSVFQQDGRWYALSKRNEFLGSDVVVWSAPHPWGPFDGGRTVASLPSDAATGQLRYMPLAHPDLLPRPGTVVVSYSRNRTDFEQVLENPFLYRPHFTRVQLAP